MQELYAIIGRKQVEIEGAHAVQRELLNILHDVAIGKISKDRIVIDLKTNECTIKPESQPAPVNVPVEE